MNALFPTELFGAMTRDFLVRQTTYNSLILRCETVRSNNLTVGNALPTHTTPILNATGYENYTTYNLTVYNQSTLDADGDNITNFYSWYKDGINIQRHENDSETLFLPGD